MGQGAGENLRLDFITSKHKKMENEKPSQRRTKDEGGISGEHQSGPGGSNEPHGRSSHSDPGMTPGISQAAKDALKNDDNQQADEEAASEQVYKEASTERD